MSTVLEKLKKNLMAKGSSSNIKEIMKEGILEHQEEKIMERAEIWDYILSSSWVYKYLIEAKIIIPPDTQDNDVSEWAQ